MGELWGLGAVELAALIRNRSVSSVEVVQAHLDRIEAVNAGRERGDGHRSMDEALAAADDADRRPPAPGRCTACRSPSRRTSTSSGSATTQGVPALAEALPPLDAPIVARMKAAGAIPLARTNLPEMALRISTDNPLRGRTNNPWDPGRVAGGSSGGEGAALAAGHDAVRSRQRHRRLAAQPRVLQRHHRAQADARACAERGLDPAARPDGGGAGDGDRRADGAGGWPTFASACRSSADTIGATRARSTSPSTARRPIRRWWRSSPTCPVRRHRRRSSTPFVPPAPPSRPRGGRSSRRRRPRSTGERGVDRDDAARPGAAGAVARCGDDAARDPADRAAPRRR